MIVCLLKELLAERNLSASELSRKTGVSRPTLTTLVNNKAKGIQFDTLETLCQFLKIDFSQLFLMITSANTRIDINGLDKVDFSVPQRTVVDGELSIDDNVIPMDCIISISEPWSADAEIRPSRDAEDIPELQTVLTALYSCKEAEELIRNILSKPVTEEMLCVMEDSAPEGVTLFPSALITF